MARKRNPWKPGKNKISNTEMGLALVMLLGVLAAGGLVKFPQQKILMTMGIVLALGVSLIVLLIVRQYRRNAKVREGLRKLEFELVDMLGGPAFERYVGAMLERLGFRSIKYTAHTNDHGIDITAKRDGLKYAIQVKRYTGMVGKAEIYPVTSKRHELGRDVAMVITNSYFTIPARNYAKRAGCELVDRDELARWREELD